jgi:hypothetical protein
MKISQSIASIIWNFCEYREISLGKLAPYVVGLMIGRKPHKQEKRKKYTDSNIEKF